MGVTVDGGGSRKKSGAEFRNAYIGSNGIARQAF